MNLNINYVMLMITFPLLLNDLQSQAETFRIGLLSTNSLENFNTELQAAYEFLVSQKKIKPELITFKRIQKSPGMLAHYDALWFHRVDSSSFTNEEIDHTVLTSINNYIAAGGKLLLTLDAFRYTNELGIEKTRPEVRYILTQDEGHGRKLGLHSFREHPCFNGLFGGAYICSPHEDMSCRQVGYFDQSRPQNGKVVAVDWAYIHVRENSKLMVEYHVNKGHVLAVGAYTYLAIPNSSRKHLELFLENCLRYLTGSFINQKASFWDHYSISTDQQVVPMKSRDKLSLTPLFFPEATVWDQPHDSMTIKRRFASDNFFDVAGKRMVIMGKESGGIDETWAHPFMALRDYRVAIQFSNEDTLHWLHDQRPQIEVRPESFTRIYKFRRAYLKVIITVDPEKAVGIVHYEYRGVYPAKLGVTFFSNLRFMWPYSEHVLGQISYKFDDNTNAFIFSDKNSEFCTMVGANRNFSDHKIGRFGNFAITDSVLTGISNDKFIVGGMFQIDLKMNDNIDVVIAATHEGLSATFDVYRETMENPGNVHLRAIEYAVQLLKNYTTITSPDVEFNKGYRWALIGSDRFFVNTPGVGQSLVAGYATTAKGWDGGHEVNGRPGYAWYFGRDAEWSGFAMLDYGDFEKVKAVLEFLQTYQDLSGKILHELTTSGCAHYDAADATPLYIILAGKYLRHSGDLNFIRQSWQYLQKALDFCFSTDSDGDHLIENTNVGHGWIEGGKLFGAHTTLYLASCWAAALKEASYMAAALGFQDKSDYLQQEAYIVKNIIQTEFWNNEKNFFSYGKFKDGSFNPEPTVLAAMPLYFKQATPEQALSVLPVYAANDFTSDWGVRILSEKSPLFDPRGYHYGSIWPLFTGWTALAEYQQGAYAQGYSHIMNNLLLYRNWALGFVDEVLHGAEFKPSGVCPHQCWSETMILQPALEGMLGLELDALKNEITIAPRFPAHWDAVTIDDIRIRNDRLSIKLNQSDGKTTYKFLHRGQNSVQIHFNPSFPPGTDFSAVVVDGKKVKFDQVHEFQAITAKISFTVTNKVTVEFHHSKGISVLPHVSHPKPNYISEGFRIISATLKDDVYYIEIQGRSENEGSFDLYVNNYQIESIQNGTVEQISEKIYRATVVFEKAETSYVNKTIIVNLKI